MNKLKTTKRLIVVLSMAVIIFVTALNLIACREQINWVYYYIPTADSFSLELEVDKTDVRIGDTITATATFKNLSDKNLWIRVHPCRTISYQALDLHAHRLLNSKYMIILTDWDIDIAWNYLYGLRKNEVIMRTWEVDITEQISTVSASVMFISSYYTWFNKGTETTQRIVNLQKYIPLNFLKGEQY